MSKCLQRAFQNLATNWVPRSAMMGLGSPCSLKTCSWKSSSSCSAVVVSRLYLKWLIFVSRHVTTSIALYPCDQGSPVTKSIEGSFQGPSGIGRGRRIAKGACLEVLERLQTWKSLQNRSMSRLISGQKWVRVMSSRVFDLSGCPAAGVQWAFLIIRSLRGS